jgi:hypothetical protein
MVIDVVSCKIWRLKLRNLAERKRQSGFQSLTTRGNLSKFCKKEVYAFSIFQPIDTMKF